METISTFVFYVGLIIFAAHFFTALFERTRVPDVLPLIILGILVGPIFDIVSQAFTGLAVLFPTTVAVLYWDRVRANSCIVSIIVGEILVGWSYWSSKSGNAIPDWFTQGFHFSTPVILITILTLWISTEIEERLANNTSS